MWQPLCNLSVSGVAQLLPLPLPKALFFATLLPPPPPLISRLKRQQRRRRRRKIFSWQPADGWILPPPSQWRRLEFPCLFFPTTTTTTHSPLNIISCLIPGESAAVNYPSSSKTKDGMDAAAAGIREIPQRRTKKKGEIPQPCCLMTMSVKIKTFHEHKTSISLSWWGISWGKFLPWNNESKISWHNCVCA